jgi:hypothetical protein
MQITYAGIVIAQEPDFGGFDAVQGFELEGEAIVQKVQGLRAAYVAKIPRSNRDLSLKGIIIPPSSDTLADAMTARDTFYGSLPDQGTLTKQIGNALHTYANACLRKPTPLKNYKGAVYAFELMFEVNGPPAVSAATLLGTESGNTIGTESGNSLGTES